MNNDELVKIISKIVKEKLNGSSLNTGAQELMIPVGVSARHVHLTREHVDILFGEGYEIKKAKELMGGQFAAEESVTIIGSKLTAIEKVRILGPLRKNTQVEVSKTDSIKLGIKTPIRESGNLVGSAPITIVGPYGAVHISEGCIIAKRHIHFSEEDAKRFNVKDNETVSIEIPGERSGIMQSVQVRVDKSFTLEMHIDTDEANAYSIKSGDKLKLFR